TLPRKAGPLYDYINEDVLVRNKVYQVDDHGRSFTGNNCKRYLSDEVLLDVSTSLKEKQCELSENQNLYKRTVEVSDRFVRLMSKNQKVESPISHCNPILPDELP
ncbi:unnamed protein product, partial [Owenia fusiformis]